MDSATDNRTTELLPCPFCGGNARLTTWTPTAASISCIMCGAHFNTYTKAEAIAAWNTRTERTCRIVKTWSDSDYIDDWNYRCSECMGFIPVNERDPETGDVISAANFCPNCGAKVVNND